MKAARLHPTFSRGRHMGDVIVEPTAGDVAELETDLTWLGVHERTLTPAADAVIVPEIDAHDLATILDSCGWSCTITSGGAS